MSVNDLLAQGATSLFFLDYYSTSRLDVEAAAEFVEGVAEGCKQAGCALIGGETAEMPGMYATGEYDAAGCAVGAVNKDRLLPDLKNMVEGDILIGLGSNGVHSNGYSLIRKIIEMQNLRWDEPAPWNPSASVGGELLTPTRIYVKPLLGVANKGLVKGMSHITGGGLTENVPRMLPEHLAAEIDVASWPLSPVFNWLKRAGNVASPEFARTWNTGLGFVIVVSWENHSQVIDELKVEGENAFVVGKLVPKVSSERCILNNLQSWD
jgi:phosphoribosylaminoimidazole synthetase